MKKDNMEKTGPQDRMPTAEEIEQFQEHLQKTFAEMSNDEKKDLGKHLSEIIMEESQMDKVLANFQKIAKTLAEGSEAAQEEFNRQAKKLD